MRCALCLVQRPGTPPPAFAVIRGVSLCEEHTRSLTASILRRDEIEMDGKSTDAQVFISIADLWEDDLQDPPP